MIISVIASGSNGNACLVEEGNDKILIDAGKSCVEIERRLHSANKSLRKLCAVVLSHAHTDHCSAVGIIARKYNVPVYMTRETYTGCSARLGSFSHIIFKNKSSIKIGSLEIYPVETSHDSESSGFVINEKFGLFTDTGMVTAEMKAIARNLKSILIESNYDEEMLVKGAYPAFLKKRIASDRGHLSNLQASYFIQEYGDNFNQVLLGHLSGNNNTPESVEKTFNTIVKRKTRFDILSRDYFSGSWEI